MLQIKKKKSYLQLKKLMNQKKYFLDLDVMRFFASFMVIFEHVNTMKLTFGLQQIGHFKDLGLLAIVMFFAQSGFLITLLLLKEKKMTGTIHFGNYFMRRSLRIWPVYFFVLILSLFFINKVPFMQVLGSIELYETIITYDYFMLFFLMPHFVDAFVPYFAHAWSIGIEEQFYILQPLYVKYLSHKKKLFIGFLVLIIIASELFQILVLTTNIFDLENYNQATWALRIYNTLKYFGCIGIGCLSALLYLNYNSFNKFIFKKKFQRVLYSVLAVFLIVAYVKHNIRPDDKIYAILFSLSFVNLCFNPQSILQMTNTFFAYLT